MSVSKLAAARHERNRGSATNKPQVEDADPVGIAGEFIFARWGGLEATPINALGPDRGWDFVTWDKRTIDVKSTNYGHGDPDAKRRIGLFADEGAVRADIYVLVYVDDIPTQAGSVLGWATAAEMKEAPLRATKKPGTNYELKGHWIHRFKLHPPRELNIKAPKPLLPDDPDALIEDVYIYQGRRARIKRTGDDMMAWLEMAQDDRTVSTAIYRVRKKSNGVLRSEWHVVGREPSTPGTFDAAAAAGLRRALIEGSTFPEPMPAAAIEAIPTMVNVGLDFSTNRR